MSRIGKNPVAVPDGVQVNVDGQTVSAKGKKGELSVTLMDDISVSQGDDGLTVATSGKSRLARTMWATSRTLISNIIVGVSDGFEKKLEISGVGYRAAVQGKDLVLQLGYSHEVRYPIPTGIDIKCPSQTEVVISGIEKQKVGQIASEIRGFRAPEPFKGKGIKYAGEQILRKEGKKK
ncbi:MAG: 50S ribosomal protein L6 [Pseudomonadota bacterium]